MAPEIFDKEDVEDIADETARKELLMTIETERGRYRDLFGELPDEKMTLWKMRDKIRVEMIRRDLRPYKLN